MTELAFDYYSHFGVLFSVEGQQILKKIKGNNVEFSITIMRGKKVKLCAIKNHKIF